SYRGSLFVAYHGSWNRTVPTGYKIVRVPFRDGRPSGPVEDFATGWLQGGRVLGRPVGLQAGADGALYLSTDDAIYRISYRVPYRALPTTRRLRGSRLPAGGGPYRAGDEQRESDDERRPVAR